jgi:hypothetical protein
MYVVIAVAMIMLLRDLGPYGAVFLTCFFTTLDFPVILEGQFSSESVMNLFCRRPFKNMTFVGFNATLTHVLSMFVGCDIFRICRGRKPLLQKHVCCSSVFSDDSE